MKEDTYSGKYYEEEIANARNDGRICRVDYQPDRLVHTSWDLGISEKITIWFLQDAESGFNVIDFLEFGGLASHDGFGMENCFKTVMGKGYQYGEFYAPNDVGCRSKASGISIRNTVRQRYGVRFHTDDSIGLDLGIHYTGEFIMSCSFDERKCHNGILALESYKFSGRYDSISHSIRIRPLHDPSSAAADAFRTLAVNSLGIR